MGASVGNRSVVCDYLSYVNIIFIGDPPVGDDCNCVDRDVGDFGLVSGVDGCNIHSYMRGVCLGCLILFVRIGMV